MAFLVVMYGCESWTIKKAECRRIDAFELWCWKRLLRVPWTARRTNQSILKVTSPGCSLEVLMLKLKLQYFCHLIWRTDSFEKTLMLGKTEGGRRREQRGWDGWMASPTQWTWFQASSRSWWLIGKPGVLQSMGSQTVGHDWATELNWNGIYIHSAWSALRKKHLLSRNVLGEVSGKIFKTEQMFKKPIWISKFNSQCFKNLKKRCRHH